MEFAVTDTKYANRLYLSGGLEAQFVDHQATVSPEVAYRMSRLGHGQYQVENKTVPFNSDSWKRDKRLIWSANVSSANGFGMVAENTIKELLTCGVTVQNPGSVSGSVVSGGEFVDQTIQQALSQTISPDALEIQYCQPPSFVSGVVERSWLYSMFETTHTPKRWIPLLNQAERVLVPSRWLVPSWKKQGVTVPISVYPHGVDPAVYAFRQRPVHTPYTFLHYGRLSTRKGTDLVYQAFTEEFAPDEPVRLILKDTYPICPVVIRDPRVQWIHATYSKEQMARLMTDSDCFVYPTRGDGFGLPALEALATGLPTIVTGWSGPVDYSDPSDTLILDYSMTRAFEFDAIYKDHLEAGEDTGLWAQPSMSDLREKMRWCYEHPDLARNIGKQAAKRIESQWTWKTQVRKLLDLIEQNVT